MTDLTHDHPAVEALGREGFDHEGGTMHAWRCEHPDRYPGYCACPEEAVAIVRDNLTADDLRNTPVAREFMEIGWKTALTQLGALAGMYAENRDILMAEDLRYARDRIADHNPYKNEDS